MPIRPELCFLHSEDRIGASDAVQGATYGAAAGFCEKCGLSTACHPLSPAKLATQVGGLHISDALPKLFAATQIAFLGR